ncbi:PREDICTED: telomere repeats-binding bouquet formation protein 1-like [Branchiostoma belcheri]|uniref:Telomere repeats-binding bouquet formation protein 1-like n=1 Tax=Branchiostoma belcheri TaxID=7741 RepID=A0A6P4XN08_BRABE|nr:PREDICTED: telomere repeats-binding bouquet formation protein 1-like [Branchiostoma belcheri]
MSSEALSSLTVLLDCIKTQKDCPQAQKQALVALAHLCMENGAACERLEEKGGLMSVLHLAVFTKNLEVQQAALYTLSCAAQINRGCQSKLCIPQVFSFLQSKLSDQLSAPEVKRTAAFLANCLTSNNREGQRLARERRCMVTMIQLFLSSLPLTYATNPAGQSQLDSPQDQAFELWTAVTNGLAACVNNPQNEENQFLCSGTFAPVVKLLNDGCISPAVRPICYYLGMVISNNTRGLQELHQLKAVPLMVQLLSLNLQDPQLQLQVLLTILHLTEMNKDIQHQLISAGGLSVVLHSMARNQSAEYNKAATYLLKTCVHLDEMSVCSLLIEEEIMSRKAAAAEHSENTSVHTRNPDYSKCPGCSHQRHHPQLDSHTYNRVVHSSVHTCPLHRAILDMETDYVRRMKARRDAHN